MFKLTPFPHFIREGSDGSRVSLFTFEYDPSDREFLIDEKASLSSTDSTADDQYSYAIGAIGMNWFSTLIVGFILALFNVLLVPLAVAFTLLLEGSTRYKAYQSLLGLSIVHGAWAHTIRAYTTYNSGRLNLYRWYPEVFSLGTASTKLKSWSGWLHRNIGPENLNFKLPIDSK